MCGRYFIDEEMAQEIERILKVLDGRREIKMNGRREVYPSESAPVLCAEPLKGEAHSGEEDEKEFCKNAHSNRMQGKTDRNLNVFMMKWGFPAYRGNSLIINARAESAMEKRTFAEYMEKNRCVVPAAGFYEWNRRREKCEFYRGDSPVLFMAGCYCHAGEKGRFTILTTAANASVRTVHDRMPLVLEKNEISDWLFDRGRAESLLKKEPVLLKRRQEYEQISFV